MYELIQVANNSYYIQSPAKIGLVKINDKEVCLIDSGNDKDAGKKIKQILDANSWTLKAIYNTHSNADHIGGNQYLQNQTGCRIYAPGIECAFTKSPILEPSFLYGGFPPKDLRHKFLMAKESDAEVLCESALLKGMEIINLPGHFFDMVGFKTDDDVIYLADCLFGKETLEKYQISFIYDVAAFIDTLEMVKKLEAKAFVPSHTSVVDNIIPLAQLNIDKVNEIADKIVEICEKPVCFEQILQRVFIECDLKMNFEQYVLIGSTVRSYLAWLKDINRVNGFFDKNLLLWEKM